MNGRDLGKIVALLLAPVFAAPLAVVAQMEKPEAKPAAKAPAKPAAGEKKAEAPKKAADQTAKPEAKPKPEAAKKKPAPLSRKAAERRYQEGIALEKKRDEKGALTAYLAAGEAGHGLAQKRLGEIYEKGNSATRRDYDIALRWYEKARKQGVEIPKPHTFQKGH